MTVYNSDVQRFIEIAESLAKSAKIAAEAYARKVDQPTVVVNVQYEPGTNSLQDVGDAVRNAMRGQRPRDQLK